MSRSSAAALGRLRHSKRIAATLTAVLGAAAVVLSAAGPASSYTPAPCGTGTAIPTCPPPPNPNQGYPPGQPAYTSNDCLWGYVLSRFTWQVNQTGPDDNNQYFTANFTMPPGSKVILKGQFPHSRAYSFTTYGTVNGEHGVNTGGFDDVQIEPDPGSQNPFRPGVRRNIKNRSFTLTIDSGMKPANPAPNTFYIGLPGQTDTDQRVNLSMRVILPDQLWEPISPLPANAWSNIMGGVAPPVPTFVDANGNSLSGEAACSAMNSTPGFPNAPGIYLSGIENSRYQMLRDSGPFGHPAQNPPKWMRYYNGTAILKQLGENTPFQAMTDALYNETSPQGFFANPASKYLITFVDRRLGPDPDPDGHNVLVLRFKIPTTPVTYKGNPQPNNNGSVEARLTSLCSYTSPAVATNIQSFTSCLNDEEMLPDKNRMVTLVLSLAEDRPANARAECGVGWFELTPYGDNFGIWNHTDELIDPGVLPGPPDPPGTNPYLSFMVIRQTYANPNFAQSYLNIPTNATIEEFLGDYYPGGTYMTPDQFDETYPCKKNQLQ